MSPDAKKQGNGPLGCYMVVVFDCAQKGPFLRSLRRVAARTQMGFSVVFPTFDGLCVDEGMVGEILRVPDAQVFVCQDSKFVCDDILHVARRGDQAHNIFTSASELTHCWPKLLRCWAALRYRLESCRKESRNGCVSVSRKALFKEAGGGCDLRLMLARLCAEKIGTALDERRVFLSSEGVRRLGGLKKFLELGLSIGNLVPRQAGECVLLDAGSRMCDGFRAYRADGATTIPSVFWLGQDKVGLCDVVPSLDYPQERCSEKGLSAPRCLLQICCAPDGFELPARDSVAGFVVSSYNKALYIGRSLFSLLMQSYGPIRILVVDDGSSDSTLELLNSISNLVEEPDVFQWEQLVENRGTYWIRNHAVHSWLDGNVTYFVNDADDVSSMSRALVQLGVLAGSASARVAFGDIVRMDSQCKVSAVDGQVERYGTASLCSDCDFHKEVGYYENLRKNADTEFIERVRKFKGREAVLWFRYPVLFQTFDGDNLTQDIYKWDSELHQLSSNLSARAVHVELFRKRHQKVSCSELPECYTFPEINYPKEYRDMIPEFLLPEGS